MDLNNNIDGGHENFLIIMLKLFIGFVWLLAGTYGILDYIEQGSRLLLVWVSIISASSIVIINFKKCKEILSGEVNKIKSKFNKNGNK